MSTQPFRATSTNALLAQPLSTGQLLYSRSTSGSDAMTLKVHGNVAGVYANETDTLAGRLEVPTTASFQSLLHTLLGSAPVGAVSVFGPGTAAVGSILTNTVPVTGATLTIGVTGFTTIYTAVCPCRETIVCPAGASLVTTALPASYVKLTLNGTVKYFWFSNGTTTNPAPGGTGYAVTFTGADTAATIATALQASMTTNLTAFANSLSTATITLTGIALGALTISQNAASFTLTVVEAGTTVAANQVRTGYDITGAAITAAQHATYLNAALMVSGTAGTDYGTGTAANTYLTSTVSGAIVTPTDRLGCSRQIGWAFTQSSTYYSLQTPIGGVDGTLLAYMGVGVTQAYTSITCDNEALAANLPAGFTFTSDWIVTGGRRPTLLLGANSSLTFTYQTMTANGVTAYTGATTIAAVATGGVVVPLGENAHQIRLLVTNSGTTAKAVSAFVVY